MDTPPDGLSEREERFGEIVFNCLQSVEQGMTWDPGAVLARHPEFAVELAEFFADEAQLRRLAAPLREVAEAAQLPLIEESLFVDAQEPGVLGDYQILREVGRGGMGIVYEARQISLDRRVALKVLPFAAAIDPKYLRRFTIEAQAAALLHHTNIVPVHAVGSERGVHFFAMQFIEGRTLADLIRELRSMMRESGATKSSLSVADSAPANSHVSTRSFPSATEDLRYGHTLDPGATQQPSPAAQPANSSLLESSGRPRDFVRVVAGLGLQAAEALAHAHEQGVVHRDIKPSNLIVDRHGNLWVTDFGLAHLQGDETLTLTGDVLGTLRYMSPEQALGEPIDHRTDIYSLGLTLYELLTLKPVFTGRDRSELLHRIADEEPEPVRRLNPTVPQDLSTIVGKAMAKSAPDRYATANELADDLRRFLEQQPIKAKAPTPLDRMLKWCLRHRPLVAAAVLLLALAASGLALGSVMIARERDEARRQRAKAETNFLLARKAVDDYLNKVSEDRLLAEPGLEPLRRELLESALGYYRAFIAERAQDSSLKAELARAYLRVGAITELTRSRAGAKGDYHHAVAVFEEVIVSRPDDVEVRAGLALGWRSLGGCEYEAGDPSAADRAFRKAIELWQRLVDDAPTVASYRLELARTYDELGVLESTTGEPRVAEQLCQAGVTIARELEGSPADSTSVREALARGYLSLAMAQRHTDLTSAAESCREAVDRWHRLASDRPRLQSYQRLEAMSRDNLAIIQSEAGQLEVAKRSHEQAAMIWNKLVTASPEVAIYRHGLARCRWHLGRVAVDLGDTAFARGSYLEAIGIQEALVRDFPGQTAHVIALVTSYSTLGRLLLIGGDSAGARGRYEQAIRVCDSALGRDPNNPVIANELALLLAMSPVVELREPPRAVTLAARAVDKAPRSGPYWGTLGLAHYRAGDWKAAILALERATDLSAGGRAVDLFVLAMAHARRGDQEQARRWYQRATDLMEEGRPRDALLDRLRKEAAGLLGISNRPDQR